MRFLGVLGRLGVCTAARMFAASSNSPSCLSIASFSRIFCSRASSYADLPESESESESLGAAADAADTGCGAAAAHEACLEEIDGAED